MTATTFCIALTSAHSRPSNGIEMTAWMSPPVTMFAVPIVSRTKPQKMPACISPARASLNIFVWTKAYRIRPDEPGRDVGERTRAGRAHGGEDPQVAGHRQHEERGRAPEDEEDQRVGRDVGERLEHGQTAALPVVERSGQRLEGVVEDRDDRLERLDRALRAARAR